MAIKIDKKNNELSDQLDATMFETTYAVPRMDCPSEERLVRMALAPVEDILTVDVDLALRKVKVVHIGDTDPISRCLMQLGLGATFEGSSTSISPSKSTQGEESNVLKLLLVINAVMFLAELGVGVAAQSTGLIADSLDMLADAAIYGLTLVAVGQTLARQQRAARLSGWVQMLLAFAVIGEVIRKAWFGSEPLDVAMIAMGLVALAANLLCLKLLARHREGGVHMKASWIFSTSDVLVNLGVVAAGILVALTESALPDLVIGAVVGLFVLTGAVRILRLRDRE